MLLQLEEGSREDVLKLIEFANQLKLQLSIVGENEMIFPGEPLSSAQLDKIISDSRRSGKVDLNTAHQLIRKNFNADKVYD